MRDEREIQLWLLHRWRFRRFCEYSLVCCVFLSGRRLGCRTYKEEETGRSILGADVTHCGRSEKDAPHWPQHVLPRRSGAYQLGQDQILFGSL